MIFFFEVPILLIVACILALLGINVIPVIMIFLIIGLLISILWGITAEYKDEKRVSLGAIIVHVVLILLLYGKSFSLFDVLEWLF